MFNKSSIIYEIFSIPLQYSTCVCFIYFNSSHKHIFFFMAFCNMNEAKKTKMLIFKLLRGFFFTEGLYGMAIAGGVIIGIASILGLSFAMVKRN